MDTISIAFHKISSAITPLLTGWNTRVLLGIRLSNRRAYNKCSNNKSYNYFLHTCFIHYFVLTASIIKDFLKL